MRRRSAAEPRTWRTVSLELARLTGMLLITVLLQATLAPHIRILGANPDFALLMVVCVGLLRGPEVGAVVGFVVGALTALAVFGPPGVASLVLVLVGYLAGRYAEVADTSSVWGPVFVVFAGTAVAELIYMVAQFLLGRSVSAGFFFTRAFLPALVLNTLLAAPAYLGARLWLREGIEDGQQA